MPKFDVNMVVSGYYWAGTAQDLADEILKVMRKTASGNITVETIEVKEVGVKAKTRESYFRR